MRDLDKELSSIKKQAFFLMLMGWTAGIGGAAMIWGLSGAFMAVGFPAMWFGWELSKKAVETQLMGNPNAQR